MSKQPLVELGSPIAFRSVSLGRSCYSNTLTAAWKVAIGGSDLGCVGGKTKTHGICQTASMVGLCSHGLKKQRCRKRLCHQQGSRRISRPRAKVATRIASMAFF